MFTPKWASFDIFQKALKNYLHEDVQLVNFTSTNAVPEGDNYTSDLFRTTLIYLDKKNNTKDTLSVIVKIANEEGGVKTDIAKNLNLFEKEIEMFTRTFPAIYQILGKHYSLSSKCLYAANDSHSIIILEDLTNLNFKMLPRHLGFDLEHCFKVIQKMAQMHAASIKVYEKDPALFKWYKQGLYPDNELIRNWVSSGYNALTDACSKWPGFEKYSYKLSALGEEILDRSFAAIRTKIAGFHVLNHGDLWVNNMLFSYDPKTSKLKDMRFVDFQMNIYTSPAIDLHYFIATSTNMEVKNECIDMILDFYYAELISNLAGFCHSLDKVPSREDFRKDYKERAIYGLMSAATVLPFVKAESRKDASFESVLKDNSLDGFKYHAYNNERYRKHMEFLLPYYDSFGVLD